MDIGKKILVFAAISEAATGLALLVQPTLVGQLLVGEELTGFAVIMARQAGIGMLGLAVACWPGTPQLGMIVYGAASAVYLACLGFTGSASGVALWSAVALHVIVTALLSWWSWRTKSTSNTSK